MRQNHNLACLLLAGATVVLVGAPVKAAPTQITGIQLRNTSGGIEVLLQTQSGERPQVFTISSGNSQVATIINTQLRLPEGNMFRQDNPAPGIASVVVTQLDANSVRVVVSGTNSTPSGQITALNEQGIVFSFNATGGITAATPTTPLSSAPPPPPPGLPTIEPRQTAQTQPPIPPTPLPPQQVQIPGVPSQGVLVPNPEITINGAPAVPGTVAAPPPPISPSAAPPFLPRAIAPPLGDIAISNIDSSPTILDLGTAERVPRLVLRDAPVREVLALLARAAGLNLAFTGGAAQPQPGQQAQQAQAGAGGTGGPTISLDVENESVQDVFNTILRLSGLQANRVGRTIFVGTALPLEARNTVIRSLRLNQASATAAANFLVGQGAELQLPITRVQLVPIGTGANQTVTRIEEPDIKVIKAQQGAGPLMLTGLSVVADQRLNSITLVGEPRKVEIASAMLSQLDLRQRQVAVNVKVIDVNLLNTDNVNTSFSFGIGDLFFASTDQGAAVNYGPVRPPRGTELAPDQASGLTGRPTIPNPFADVDPQGFIRLPDGELLPATPPSGNPLQPGITGVNENDVTFSLADVFKFPKRFLAALRAQILSQNAKILTDPTLIVQEGQTATVNLTQEVVGNITVQNQVTAGVNVTTRQVQKQPVGLILSIAVNRIDDNGFITLTVNPEVSSILRREDTGQDAFVTLVQTRSLNSGQVRLRDGQTLILSGIIQDTERTNVSKVPILGDLPLIGSLFRRTNRDNERAEVIVLVTPQILDDSERSTFGYGYRPGREVMPMLQRQNLPRGGNR